MYSKVFLPVMKSYHVPKTRSFALIGREFLRREFRFIPTKEEVVNIYMETAKYPVCSKAPAMEKAVQSVKSLTPETLISHSYATAYVVAWVMYQKYANS